MTVTRVDSGFSKKTNGKAFGLFLSFVRFLPFLPISLCCVSLLVSYSLSVQYLLLRMTLFPNFLPVFPFFLVPMQSVICSSSERGRGVVGKVYRC